MKEVLEYINNLNIKYELVEHEAVYNIEELLNSNIKNTDSICKNLFLRNAKKTQYYLVTCLHDKKIDLKKLANDIGASRLSFASSDDLLKYLKLTPGSVSPLGILNNDGSVKVILDKELEKYAMIGVHPNDNTATIYLTLDNLKKIIKSKENEIIILNL